MTQHRFKTAIVGFGKIAHGNSLDQTMAKQMRYATHAQVLSEHPGFKWNAVVDPSNEALSQAKHCWNIPLVATSCNQLPNKEDIEVLVLATPPEHRIALIDCFPSLRAVLVEKPLGIDVKTAKEFMAKCNRKNIMVEVNMLRRADAFTRYLAGGGLYSLVGKIQAVFGIYGNGLANNGTHMIDLVRMLIGEIKAAQALSSRSFIEGPIVNDVNLPFILHMDSGINVMMQPVRFDHYRENGLDIWGEAGRFSYLNGGFTLLQFKKGPSRIVDKEEEVLSDRPIVHESTIGNAFFEMYTNLSSALRGETELVSSGQSAMITAYAIEKILDSTHQSGAVIHSKPDVSTRLSEATSLQPAQSTIAVTMHSDSIGLSKSRLTD